MDRTRILLAMILSMVILMGYPVVMRKFYPPPPPVVLPEETQPQTVAEKKPQANAAAAQAMIPAPAQGQAIEAPLREISIKTDYWDVKLSNHGAAATSWILKKYKYNGSAREIRAADGSDLQLIPQPIPEALAAPLGLCLPSRPDLAAQLNKINYRVQIDGADASQNEIELKAGEQKEITFTASTGTAIVTKKFTFYGDRLICDAKASVRTGDGEQPAYLVLGPGFGDQSDRHTGSYSTPPQVIAYTTDGSREQVLGPKINQPVATITAIRDNQITLDKPLPGGINLIKIVADKGATFIGYAEVKEGQGTTSITLDAVPEGAAAGQGVAPKLDTLMRSFRWAGVGDHYFVMLGVPDQPVGEIALSNLEMKLNDPKSPPRDYPLVAVPTNLNSPTHVFVGPKDRKLLGEVGQELNAPLGAVIDYGFFGIIVQPLITPLAWSLNAFAKLFHNYGWAIVVVTILINLLLWPLRASSSKKMKKAAKHQPRMKELQERMKKLKENPKKYERELQELQQEQLALMKEANPLGGCLPLLLQMPIFWAVYMYLGMSLDVRHAPWIGWIHDLSRPDPLYILPIVMCVSMIASTQLTPQPASADPSMKMQRIMMTWLMPIMLTWFFFLSAPSGLVLYWMVSNLVGVAIQLVINKKTAEPTDEAGQIAAGSAGSRADSRNAEKPGGQKGAKGKGRKQGRRGGAEAEGF
jgi:YidC/Oxa1 family membrane protein insertase